MQRFLMQCLLMQRILMQRLHLACSLHQCAAAKHDKHTERNEYQTSSHAGAAQRDTLVHYTHSGLRDAFSCVSPVVYKDQSIGSVARIRGNGLMVSSSHIFVEKGKFLKTTAFGGHPLELVVSFPYLDIILLKGGLLTTVLEHLTQRSMARCCICVCNITIASGPL